MSKPSTRGATQPVGGRVAGRLAGRTVNVCAGPGGIEMGARILEHHGDEGVGVLGHV